MKLRTLAAMAAVLSCPAFAGDIRLIAPGDMSWDETPEGVAFADLDGDRFTEAYQAMVRLPAGTVSPPHIKTAGMFGLLLSGEMIHYAAGSDADQAPVIGAGAFYAIPGGLAHVSACVSDVPCVTYLYQDGAFDFVPVSQ